MRETPASRSPRRQTGTDGSYSIGNLPKGSYKLRFQGAGFSELWFPSSLVPDNAKAIDLQPSQKRDRPRRSSRRYPWKVDRQDLRRRRRRERLALPAGQLVECGGGDGHDRQRAHQSGHAEHDARTVHVARHHRPRCARGEHVGCGRRRVRARQGAIAERVRPGDPEGRVRDRDPAREPLGRRGAHRHRSALAQGRRPDPGQGLRRERRARRRDDHGNRRQVHRGDVESHARRRGFVHAAQPADPGDDHGAREQSQLRDAEPHADAVERTATDRCRRHPERWRGIDQWHGEPVEQRQARWWRGRCR